LPLLKDACGGLPRNDETLTEDQARVGSGRGEPCISHRERLGYAHRLGPGLSLVHAEHDIVARVRRELLDSYVVLVTPAIIFGGRQIPASSGRRNDLLRSPTEAAGHHAARHDDKLGIESERTQQDRLLPV